MHQCLPRGVVQLVHDERGEHMAACGEGRPPEIACSDTTLEAELPVRPPCFFGNPRMPIDSKDGRALGRRRGPGRTGCTRATAEVEDRASNLNGTGQAAHDVANQEGV